MARFSIYMPDELYARARQQLPDELSWSQLLSAAVTEALEEIERCPHPIVVCGVCGGQVDTQVTPPPNVHTEVTPSVPAPASEDVHT